MYYIPDAHELEKLKRNKVSAEVLEVLSGTPLNLATACPVTDKGRATEYLKRKIERYLDNLKYKGSVETIADKYVAEAMNTLLAAGFTYVNLYARDHIFLTEPHIASALAFNALNHVQEVPDDIDSEFGLTYERGCRCDQGLD